MKAFTLALCALSIAMATGSPFRPTRTGGESPEVFWVMNDSGRMVPALLHGKQPRPAGSKGIADDVQFYLYNSKNINFNVEITPGCSSCLNTFVKGAPVVILVHGFSSSHEGGFGDGLRRNFWAAEQEMNLIFVNWSKLAAAPWYETAADNTKPVGEYTAQLIEFLVTGGFASMSDFHFAGHSLGSHVANFVAHALPSPMKLPRIHALDPALPLFGIRPDSERIDPSDGDFVNVIHTAMGTLLDGGLAFTEPRGHIDFYANSGKNQPGCEGEAFGSCSHSRAHEYFGESANRPNAFGSCPCATWEEFVGGECDCLNPTPMGWATPSNARGIFHLRTNRASPFGIGNGL